MDIFKRNYHNDYKNPYRHGVFIGNHIEDKIGDDLKSKQENHPHLTNYASENMDKYKWPELKEIHIKDTGNHLTKNHNSNFDLNIDFTSKNIEDYLKLHNTNIFQLGDKNSFLPDQHNAETKMKKMEESLSGTLTSNDILNETQKKLRTFHQNDTRNLFNTSKSGLVKNLFFGHGLDQNNFTKNEYVSTYNLTIGEKERTDKVLNPRYVPEKPFMKPAKKVYDKSDWNFRNYKKYDEFTKFYDKKTNIEY